MTIDKHQGELYAMCDTCGEEFKDKKGDVAYYDEDSFDVLIEDLKDAGWRISRIGHAHYDHYCPDCQT